MSTDNDVARSLRSWVREERHEDADRVLDAVFDQVPATPQRRAGWLARRSTVMSNSIRIAVAAAVLLVVVAFVGYQLLGSNVGGPGATPTPEPTSTPSVAPSAAASEAAGLPLGPFHLTVAGDFFDLGMTVTIAADAWDGGIGTGVLVHGDNTDNPDGAGLIVFTGDLYVYGDPCHWSTTKPATPATSVDELVAALTAQASRVASAPVDVTLDGYAGKSITLHVPDDAAHAGGKFSDCDQGIFGSWAWGTDATPSRYAQGPGQIDEVWILDVNGVPVVIDAAYYAGTPADVVDEMRAIVESTTFQLP
jgi:hypothetical protein